MHTVSSLLLPSNLLLLLGNCNYGRLIAMKLSHLYHFLCLVTGLCIGVTISYCLSFYSVDLQAISLSSSGYYHDDAGASKLRPAAPETPPDLQSLNKGMVSDSDQELFKRALLTVSVEKPDKAVPKVAFMFLAKGRLPLAPLWEMFFKGHEGLYSIYVHSSPLHVDSAPQDSVFYGKRVPSQEVQWGTASIMDAERRLVANALLDVSNQRFILLSESCIPLFNFTTVYNYIINSNLSHIDSIDDPRKIGRGRYNKLMSPTILLDQWRKGSQWFEAKREIAMEIVSDIKHYPLFVEHCHIPCYIDEHYIPTLVNILHPWSNLNRSITWVDWSKPGPHPGRFGRPHVYAEVIDRIRFGGNCTFSPCFLFARKFNPDSLQPLLQIMPLLLGFDQ